MAGKRCPICGDVLPVRMFYAVGGRNGKYRNSYCKTCDNKVVRPRHRMTEVQKYSTASGLPVDDPHRMTQN